MAKVWAVEVIDVQTYFQPDGESRRRPVPLPIAQLLLHHKFGVNMSSLVGLKGDGNYVGDTLRWHPNLGDDAQVVTLTSGTRDTPLHVCGR